MCDVCARQVQKVLWFRSSTRTIHLMYTCWSQFLDKKHMKNSPLISYPRTQQPNETAKYHVFMYTKYIKYVMLIYTLAKGTHACQPTEADMNLSIVTQHKFGFHPPVPFITIDIFLTNFKTKVSCGSMA